MSAVFAHWTPKRIREVFAAHDNMTIPRLAHLTGRDTASISDVLVHRETISQQPE